MRKFSLLLIFLLLTSLVCSCGVIEINRPDTETEVTTPVQTTVLSAPETDPPIDVTSQAPTVIPEPYVWDIPKEEAEKRLNAQVDLSFKDSTLFIVDGTKAFSSALIENNDYSEALYERNNMITEKYGFKITVSTMDNATMFEDFKATVSSGNTYCDLLSVPAHSVGLYITSGLVVNQRSLAFFDSKETNAPDGFKGCNVAGNDVYFSCGYSTLTPSDLTSLYFNKSILEKLNVDLYEEILSGRFTIERYRELVVLTQSSVVIANDIDLPLISLEATGTSLLDTGYGINVTLSGDKVSKAISDSSRYLSSLFFSQKETTEEKDDYDIFCSNEALFRIGTLADMENLYEQKVFWGLSPLPCAEEGAEYTTPVNSSIACLMIPKNTTKSELTSIAINALNAASYEWLCSSAGLYYSKYQIPDVNCVETIKLIIKRPVFSFSATAQVLSPAFKPTFMDTIFAMAKGENVDLNGIISSGKLGTIQGELSKYYWN